MMKKKLWLLLGLIISILIATPVLAAGTYRAVIEVTDTSGSSRTGVPAHIPFNSEGAVAAGLMASDGLDTRMFEGTSERYYMVTDNVTGLLISSLDANQKRSYNFETGYTPPNTSFGLIPGTDGYVTVTEDAALELGSNFTIEQKGWIDTSAGSNKNLVYKAGAFKTYVSGSGNITSNIAVQGATFNLLPNAAGDYTGIADVIGAPSHWEAMDDPVGSPDDFATYVSTSSTSQQKDAYHLTSPSWLGSEQDINSVTVHFRWYPYGTDEIQPFLRLGTNETTGTLVSDSGSVWINESETLSRPGGGTWSTSDFEDLQVAIGLRDPSGSSAVDATQVYVTVNYNYFGDTLVTAAGVSSGEHTVKTTADGTNLKIFIDDVEKDSVALAGASVPGNTNNWILNQNNVMPYMEYYKHTVGGTLIAWYQPNDIINGTTLPDREGTAQDGVITWGSNSDLTVTVGGLKTIASYVSTSAAEGEPPVVVGAPGDITGFYPSETEITDMPWYDLISRASRGQAVYSTGTVSGTANSTTLTGSSTSWDSGWRGYTVVITGDSTIYYIESINSPTSITLASALDTSPSGAAYSITTPSLGWTTNDFYGVLGIFVGVAVGVGVAVATGSALLAALAVGIGLAVAAGTGTLGVWVVLVYALVAATYIVVSRSM